MLPPSPSASLLIAPFFLVHICITLASEPALEMGAPDPIAECTEGTFTWQGGRPPYTLSVSGFDPNTLLFEKTNFSDTVFNWFASVAANTLLTVELTDTGVDGASGARISNSFIIQPGSDSCLAAASSSTAQQATDTSASPLSSSGPGQRTTTSASSTPPVSTSASRTNVDTDTVTAAPSPSPTNSSSSRTLPGSTAFSTTGPVGASIEVATSQPGSASASASASASSTQPSGSPDPSSQDGQSGPTGAQGGGPFAPGAIAGVAVASLVAGFGLATGFFCLWRRSRRKSHRASRTGERRGGLESYDCPATDVVLTRPASPRLGHRGALDFERGHNAHAVAHNRPGKARFGGFLSPSTQMQRATFPRPDVMIWEDAEPSRLVDSLAEECRGTDDLVGRRWPDSGDPDEEFVYSEGSTAPPPYSQIV